MTRTPLAEIPVVPVEDLNTLPPGLYQTTRRERKQVHDIICDQSYEGECVLLARVSEPGVEFPRAEQITVRPDGNWIIYQWVKGECG